MPGYPGHTPVSDKTVHPKITYWFCKCGVFLGYSKGQAKAIMRGHRAEIRLERERNARS